MEFILMLVAGGLMLAVICAAISRSGSVGGPANNTYKKDDVSAGSGHALSFDEAYRGGAGASFGRSYIGLEGINNDPLQ
jgi:hypothetical protein